jgi:hypothetical protein
MPVGTAGNGNDPVIFPVAASTQIMDLEPAPATNNVAPSSEAASAHGFIPRAAAETELHEITVTRRQRITFGRRSLAKLRIDLMR